MAVDTVGAATVAAAQTTKARNALSGNMDTFLRLLTTQLQYQDPLEPMDASKFTEQLVSYSQVEQQINTNANLETLLAMSKSAASANAVTYLGKNALTAGNMTGLEGEAATWRYALPSDAASVTLTITDANGKAVATVPGDKTVGMHEFVWDGKNTAGIAQPNGTYGLKITAKGSDGKDLTTTVNGVGLVKEIDMTGPSPVLSVSGRIIDVSEILGFKS